MATHASLAATLADSRFGYGRAPNAPLAASPAAMLKAQLDRYDLRPESLSATPASPDLAARLAELQRTRNMQQLRELARTAYATSAAARVATAATSPAPFAERLVHFWANHFTVSADRPQTLALAGPHEFEAIRPHILGRFEDMLLASTRHPGMLLYLDQARSIGPGSQQAGRQQERGRRAAGLNENLAREILELHTLGVDGGYTQADVTELARALTGWHVSHRFCAACGQPSQVAEAGWHRLCPACGTRHFPRTDPVVIIWMAVEAPGGVDSCDSYWDLLAQGREALTPFPDDRGWSIAELLDGSRRDGFKKINDLGGFLTGAAEFDPAFFGISPREATAMDPQQRVALRLAWRALEHSGINPDDLAGQEVGCYIGASALEYGPDLSEYSQHSGHLITGTSLGVISGRIAYTLDLAGPALTVDTSCSSALAALHTAAAAIRNGDCEMALTGGVCVMGSPGYFVEFSKQHALSDDGHCRPYSSAASGTVWAEGAGIFVLGRRSAALRDGRRVLAEVLATGVNSDGRTVGLTAPSGAAQQRLFASTLRRAGVRPDDVGMVEGHGTATRLGDRTELRALADTYGDTTRAGAGALLGSVKSNIGHTQAAAGALGLAKVIIAAQRGAVPPSLHTAHPSREIGWDAQGLRLATTLTEWRAREGRRIAAVSAFGMSGTNTHAIVAIPDDGEAA